MSIKPRLKHCESGDYFEINSTLNNYDWKFHIKNNSVDSAVDYFYQKIYDTRDKHIPHRIIHTSYEKLFRLETIPLWKNSQGTIKYLNKYRIYGNSFDYNAFSLLRKRAKQLEHECYRTYITKMKDSIANYPKLLWSLIKSHRSGNGYGRLPSVLSYEGNAASIGEGISNLFS